jgi:hypothetical protein
LDCIAYNSLAILDDEAKVGMMSGKSQGLRANATANIDNQRALEKVSPAVHCQFDISS